jgi:outer membrane protein
MNNMSKLSLASAALLAVLSAPAIAQKAGSFSLEVGATKLSPQVKSGNLSPPAFPNTQTDVSDASGLTGAVNYMVSDNIAVNVPLGLGFKHDLLGAGAGGAGLGKLGEVKALPITVLGQYRFGEANASVRPYVGAGLTFAKFYKERGSAALTALTNPGGAGTTLSVESKLVPTIQFGAVFNVNEKWYVNAHYAKTFLKTTTKFSTGQTIDTKLDPGALSLAVGYKF